MASDTWRGSNPHAPSAGTVICRLGEIPDGTGREFRFGGADDTDHKPFRLIVVRRGLEAWAYVNQCAHFLVPLNVLSDYTFVDRGHIVCQVHYARYAMDSGACVRGDCEGESLISIPIRIDADHQVIIAE